MFGLTEATVGLLVPDPHLAIVPTIIIPFALIGVLISTIATYVASLFGVQLKAEGPRKLLEVLLKPRVLITMLIVNALVFGGISAWRYLSNFPKPLWWITLQNKPASLALPNSGSEVKVFANQQSQPNVFPASPLDSKKTITGIELDWQIQLPSGSFAGPILSSGELFLGSEDGNIYRIDSQTGEQLGHFYLGTSVTPLPTIWNHMLFSGEGGHDTHHARIYAFDLANGGRLKGSFASRGHIEARPQIAQYHKQDYLVFPAGADGIYAIDPNNLKKIWQFKVLHTDSEVLIDDGTVYFSSGVEKEGSKESEAKGQAVFAVELESGKLKWQAETASSGWDRPIIAGDRVCFGLGEIYIKRKYGQIACFLKSDGSPVLAFNNSAPIVSYPILVGTTLVATDTMGGLCAWDFVTGLRLWCHATEAPRTLFAAPAYDGHGHIVFQTFTDGIHVLDLATGEMVAQWKPAASEDKASAWQRPSANMVITEEGWYISDWLGTNLRKLRPIYK